MTFDWGGRRVLVTGHTGFMGGWLCSRLLATGAEVHGFALPPPTEPAFFTATRLGERIASSTIGDIRDGGALRAFVANLDPEIIFHLAAQPLVRAAHADPVGTFSSNVMGTVHLLEAARAAPSARAVVVVTTDKVYLNKNRSEPYGENDVLGGREPYSASKAAGEFVVEAYRHSYLSARGVGVATVRAGNIIGGGDWAPDRLVPDAIRGFAAGAPLVIRRPHSTRPWQHVLEPVAGFLQLAERLVEAPSEFSTGWNFGPAEEDCRPVIEIANRLAAAWGDGSTVRVEPSQDIFEEGLLALDSGRAARALGWSPAWNLDTAVEMAVSWYKSHQRGADMWTVTSDQMQSFEASR